jgi:hypothetical protein
MNCSAFFLPSNSPNRDKALSDLYYAAIEFIVAVFDYEKQTSFTKYYPTSLERGLVIAACALLKLLNSPFADIINDTEGRKHFDSAILALRYMSVRSNDLPARIAEVIMRMWRAATEGRTLGSSQKDNLSIQLRCRMSVSHVFDCTWGWRDTMRGDNNQNIPGDLSSFCQLELSDCISVTSARGEFDRAHPAALLNSRPQASDVIPTGQEAFQGINLADGQYMVGTNDANIDLRTLSDLELFDWDFNTVAGENGSSWA